MSRIKLKLWKFRYRLHWIREMEYPPQKGQVFRLGLWLGVCVYRNNWFVISRKSNIRGIE